MTVVMAQFAASEIIQACSLGTLHTHYAVMTSSESSSVISVVQVLTDTGRIVALVLLLVAAALAVIGVARGPSSLDRSIATDILIAITVAGVGLYLAETGSTTVLPILVVLSLLGFVGPVAISRLIASRSALMRDLKTVKQESPRARWRPRRRRASVTTSVASEAAGWDKQIPDSHQSRQGRTSS